VDKLLERALRGEVTPPTDIEYTIYQSRKKGWVMASYAPHYNAQGEIVGVVGVLTDITARRQAEEQVRKLSVFVEQSPAAVIITDTNGAIEYVKPKFTEMTGYQPEEVMGNSPRLLKSGEMQPGIYETIWKAISAGAEWRGQMHNRRKNGELFWVQTSISPVVDASGKITHYLSIQEDISEHRRLEEAERRRLQELEALRATMADISSELDMDKLIRKIMERVLALLDANQGMLCLYRPAQGDLEVVVSYNQNRDYTGTRFALGEGGVGTVAETRRPMIIQDYQHWEKRSPKYIDPNVSLIEMPLLSGSELLGVIMVASDADKRPFSQEDLRLVEMFAFEVAIALRNVQLLEETRRLAITDALTGIYNRRYFMERAQFEMERSRRYSKALSVLMFDIDHFKRINDRYGHLAGDQALQAVTRIARESLRNVDILGRYGGEEFVVLLPEATLSEANQAAERLRQEIAHTPIPSEAGTLQLTVSVGVAGLNASIQDVGVLIDKADQAMYRAKQSGRNKVSQ